MSKLSVLRIFEAKVKVSLLKQLSSLEIEFVVIEQIMDEAVCISCCADNFGKGMNLTFLPSAIWINIRAE